MFIDVSMIAVHVNGSALEALHSSAKAFSKKP
jgi:hypothetical protein